MSQPEYHTTALTLAPERGLSLDGPAPLGEPQPSPPLEAAEEATEDQPKKADLTQARSLLTELHPSGFGELLVTDAWLPPTPKADPAETVDRQQAWRRRQEYRELNLLREKPAASYDARTERYWKQVSEAMALAPDAIVDPYTHFAAAFAAADYEHMGDHLRDAREYGHESDALVRYGRACVAVGRLKSARSILARAAKAEPYEAEAWWNLGLAHLFARANREAAGALQRALDQSPGDSRYETALGVARFHERNYARAEEHFRRTAGPSGLRAASRSMLACSLVQQGDWDDARIELSFLRQGGSPRWAQVAEQCLDCVARCEQQTGRRVISRRRGVEMIKSLGAVGAGTAYILYSIAEHWFRDNLRWASIPVFLILMALTKSLRAMATAPKAGVFGNYEQGLPCWQATSWIRPRRQEM